MKIQLLSLAGEMHRNTTGIFKTALRYAPLTLTILAALVPEDLDAEITIQDEGVQPLDLDFEADLVGITAITGTSLRAYRIADEWRARGHTVVLGGVHATLLSERMWDARANARNATMIAVYLGLNVGAHFDIDLRQGLRLGAGLGEWEAADAPVSV
jgi:hypothetical protein